MAGVGDWLRRKPSKADFDGQRAEWTLLICMGGVDDDEMIAASLPKQTGFLLGGDKHQIVFRSVHRIFHLLAAFPTQSTPVPPR